MGDPLTGSEVPYQQREYPVPWRDLWSPPESPRRMSEREIAVSLDLLLCPGNPDKFRRECFWRDVRYGRKMLAEMKMRDLVQWNEWKVIIINDAWWNPIVTHEDEDGDEEMIQETLSPNTSR